MTPVDVLVVGFGNGLRGDDGVGLEVARRADARLRGVADVIAHPGEPVDLIGTWRGYDAVVLVDAARTHGRAGSVRRYEYGRDRFPSGDLGSSSHAFDLLVAIELADAMGDLPKKLVLYAVEGERFALGDEPSVPVLQALDAAVEEVCEDVRTWVASLSPATDSEALDPRAGGADA